MLAKVVRCFATWCQELGLRAISVYRVVAKPHAMADDDVDDPEVWIARGDKLAEEHENVNSSTINCLGIKEAIKCYQRAAELAPGELTTWLHKICHQSSRLGQAKKLNRSPVFPQG